MKKGLSETNSQNSQEISWKDDIYSKVKGKEKKGHVRCMGTVSISSNKSSSCSQSMQPNEEVQELKAEIQDLKQTLSNVLEVLQSQHSDGNAVVLNAISRMVHKEVYVKVILV